MKDSLRLSLILFLKVHKQMSIQEMEAVCHRAGRKVDNGTRRLREIRDKEHYSYNPRVGVIENKKGAIIAYTYVQSEYEKLNENYQQTGQLKMI